jgi:signal transduction histidine kinase
MYLTVSENREEMRQFLKEYAEWKEGLKEEPEFQDIELPAVFVSAAKIQSKSEFTLVVSSLALEDQEEVERLAVAARSLKHSNIYFDLNPYLYSKGDIIRLEEFLTSKGVSLDWDYNIQLDHVYRQLFDLLEEFKNTPEFYFNIYHQRHLVELLEKTDTALRLFLDKISAYEEIIKKDDDPWVWKSLGHVKKYHQLLESRIHIARGIEMAGTFPLTLEDNRFVNRLGKGFVMDQRLTDKHLRGDQYSFYSAVRNLVQNGFEAAKEVSVSITQQGNNVVIQVLDNGPGLAADQLAFDPSTGRQKIFNLNNTTKVKGTGLGTTETWYTIKDMGGKIRAENRPERGARFVIILPMADAAMRGTATHLSYSKKRIEGLISQAEEILKQFVPPTYLDIRESRGGYDLLGMLINFKKAVERSRTISDWITIKENFFTDDKRKKIRASITTFSKRNLIRGSRFRYDQRGLLTSYLSRIFENIIEKVDTIAANIDRVLEWHKVFVQKAKRLKEAKHYLERDSLDMAFIFYTNYYSWFTGLEYKEQEGLLDLLVSVMDRDQIALLKRKKIGRESDFRERLIAMVRDRAQTATNGGIDLSTSNGMQWKVSKDGRGVEMNIDAAMIERIRREGIDSLSPVIFRITPVVSIWPLVGLQAPVQS